MCNFLASKIVPLLLESLVDDSDHGLLLSCTPLGVALGVASGVKKINLLPRDFSLGCVLQPTRRGSWAPHGLCVSRGGGVKQALRSPGRSAAGRCSLCLPSLRGEANRRERVSRLREHRAERGLALTQERPEIILRGLPRTANRSGQPQARGAAPALRPSPEAAETRPGHGELSTASVSAAHSPASERPLVLPPGAKRAAEPPTRGMGGGRNQWHGQSAAAPVLPAVPPGGRMGEARRSVCSSALPSRRGAGTRPGSPAVRGGSPAATRYQPLH